MDNSTLLTGIVRRCGVELFADYGVALTEASDLAAPDGFQLCGLIGFTGDELRGMLMLALTGEPLAASAPPGAAAGRSWIGELVNQLVGRVKQRVLAHGALIMVATPLVIRGQYLAPVPRTELRPMQFGASTGGQACIWLEVEFDDGLVLQAEPQAVVGGIAEGEAVLF